MKFAAKTILLLLATRQGVLASTDKIDGSHTTVRIVRCEIVVVGAVSDLATVLLLLHLFVLVEAPFRAGIGLVRQR